MQKQMFVILTLSLIVMAHLMPSNPDIEKNIFKENENAFLFDTILSSKVISIIKGQFQEYFPKQYSKVTIFNLEYEVFEEITFSITKLHKVKKIEETHPLKNYCLQIIPLNFDNEQKVFVFMRYKLNDNVCGTHLKKVIPISFGGGANFIRIGYNLQTKEIDYYRTNRM
jgi:hypothetical protein